MVSVKDVWDELVKAQKMTRSRAFGEEERAFRRGYRDGLMCAYVTLTGDDPECVMNDVTAYLQAEHEKAYALNPDFRG